MVVSSIDKSSDKSDTQDFFNAINHYFSHSNCSFLFLAVPGFYTDHISGSMVNGCMTDFI